MDGAHVGRSYPMCSTVLIAFEYSFKFEASQRIINLEERKKEKKLGTE